MKVNNRKLTEQHTVNRLKAIAVALGSLSAASVYAVPQIIVNNSTAQTVADGIVVEGNAANYQGLLQVTGAGSKLTGKDLVINAGNGVDIYRYGAYAGNGGEINLTGGTVNTHGNNSWGLAADTGGKVTATGVSIVTTIDAPATLPSSDRAYGILSNQANSLVEFSQGFIKTSGTQSYGVLAQQGGKAILTASDIETSGYSSAAVQATSGSSITVSGSNIKTTGLRSAGVYGLGVGTTLNVSSSNIITTGDASNGHGVKMHEGALGIISDSVIKTSSASVVGAFAESSTDSTSLQLNNIQINATGTSIYSLVHPNSSDLTSQIIVDGNSSIVNTGDGSAGVRSNGLGASIELKNSGISVQASGVNSDAFDVMNGGVITADKVMLLADKGNALSFGTSTTTDTSTITLKNGSVANGAKTAVVVQQGAVGVLDVDNSSVGSTGGYGFDVNSGQL